MAVVDSKLRVYGIAGLRVADASVLRTVTNGNINMASMMIGERAADLIAAVPALKIIRPAQHNVARLLRRRR